MPTVKVAVPQWEPVWFDKKATTQKIVGLIKESADNGAKLVAFGELALPGYPTFLFAGTRSQTIPLGIKYTNNSVEIDGPEINALRVAAKDNSIIVHCGFSELDGRTLYMANVIIDEHGEIILYRRKIKPSHYERTLFGESGPESADTCVETSIGRISVLNCWEHYQPLLKYHTYSQRPWIHIAAWPILYNFSGEVQFCSSDEAGLAVTRTVAIEAGAFALCCSHFVSNAGATANTPATAAPKTDGRAFMGVGGGVCGVYAPDGRKLSRELGDTEETILYQDLDYDMVRMQSLVHDPTGHYSRPDMFQLLVNRAPAPMVVYKEADGTLTGAPSRIKPYKTMVAETASSV